MGVPVRHAARRGTKDIVHTVLADSPLGLRGVGSQYFAGPVRASRLTASFDETPKPVADVPNLVDPIVKSLAGVDYSIAGDGEVPRAGLTGLYALALLEGAQNR